MTDTKFLRKLIFFNSLIPLALMIWDWRNLNLGANPSEFVTRATGVLTLVFLLLTLLVTPLRKLFNWNWLLKQRRLLGLLAFFYGTAHLATYVMFDRDWKLGTIPLDLWRRPFISLGLFSYLLMIPLAITSTNAMIKKMGGKKWNQLHRLTYYIAIGGVIHYALIVKSDFFYPLVFGVVLAVLLGYRMVVAAKARLKAQKVAAGSGK
jgi:sulfoxide reductase heme-binding subunit YedZ